MLNWLLPLSRPAHHLVAPSPAGTGPVSAPSWLPGALEHAGLGSLLNRASPLCLLMPDDAALARHLQQRQLTLESWLSDADALRAWLMEHMVSDAIEPLYDSATLPSLGQGTLRRHPGHGQALIDAQGRTVRLGGWQHLGQLRMRRINHVLTAPQRPLLEVLAQQPQLQDAAEALACSGLAVVLQAEGPFTLLAPTNGAFARLAERLNMSRKALLGDANRLRSMMAYHLLPGRWLSHELPWGSELRTAHGATLRLNALGTLSDGQCSQPLLPDGDHQASNGVLHQVGEVLIAPAS